MRRLTVFTEHGLSNRLKLLASGQVLAAAADAEFELLWPVNSACAAPFEALFEAPCHPRVSVRAVPEESLSGLPRVVGWGAAPPDLLRARTSHVVLGHPSWLVRHDLYAAHAPLWAAVGPALCAIRPIATLRARIDAFTGAHFRPFVIGVHLRRGDFHSARPAAVGNTAAAVARVDLHLRRERDAAILLCTDEAHDGPSLRELFAARYGDRLLPAATSSLARDSLAGIENAVVDLFLLRQTHLVIGTASSSFSELAAFGRGVPFEATDGSGRLHIEVVEERLRRIGLRGVVMALARRELGREPVSFEVAWRAVVDSPWGATLARPIRRFLARRR
jgi:hypothetical protein